MFSFRAPFTFYHLSENFQCVCACHLEHSPPDLRHHVVVVETLQQPESVSSSYKTRAKLLSKNKGMMALLIIKIKMCSPPFTVDRNSNDVMQVTNCICVVTGEKVKDFCLLTYKNALSLPDSISGVRGLMNTVHLVPCRDQSRLSAGSNRAVLHFLIPSGRLQCTRDTTETHV